MVGAADIKNRHPAIMEAIQVSAADEDACLIGVGSCVQRLYSKIKKSSRWCGVGRGRSFGRLDAFE
jgi:hypothetical protein